MKLSIRIIEEVTFFQEKVRILSSLYLASSLRHRDCSHPINGDRQKEETSKVTDILQQLIFSQSGNEIFPFFPLLRDVCRSEQLQQ